MATALEKFEVHRIEKERLEMNVVHAAKDLNAAQIKHTIAVNHLVNHEQTRKFKPDTFGGPDNPFPNAMEMGPID